MTVLVDSNVLIDVLYADPTWSNWSSEAIASAAASERLIINAIIYAEIAAAYDSIEETDAVLPRDQFDREAIPFEAGFLAAQAFRLYRERGGMRTTTLPDFFIGAHAVITGYRLLTRDARRYRSYFPKLALIAPE
jgi:predicted nucleic acid-binding protein